MIVEVKNVSRSFRSPKKTEGFGGAMKLLFKPEYSTHEAVKNVSFSLESGSFNGLIGANGAGKTTLLKILSGLIAPTSGEARVLGFDPFQRPIEFRRKIALVMGQKAQLWWDLPAVDAFDLLRAIYDIPTPVYKERLHTLATLLDVTKHLNTQIRRLSLGERMKMELIGALIHWPNVIFLDEPTIGLDILAAHKLREFLKEFNRLEKAILTSHNMEDIEKLCSRVLIMRTGEIIYDGTSQGLTEKGECRLRVRLMQSPTLDELSQLSGIAPNAIAMNQNKSDDASNAGDDSDDHKPIFFTLKYDNIVAVLQKLMTKFTIINMGIEEPSLENVIQRLFQ